MTPTMQAAAAEVTPAAASTAASTLTARAAPTTSNRADAKAQEFAFRVVEFADTAACRKFFEEKAIDFDRPNDTGWSLLMRICACGRDDLVGYAIDATTNISCATVPNRTNVLHVAAMSNNPQVIRELVTTPARRTKLKLIVDTPNINGDTPLMMASVAKNVVAARTLLLELGADATFGNANGMTSLMCAARLNETTTQHPEELMAASDAIVRLLLASDDGALVNATDVAAGNTALHYAVLSHNALAVAALTEPRAAADVSLRNAAGLTAAALAKRVGASTEVTERLAARLAAMEVAAIERSRALEIELLADASVAPVVSKSSSNKAMSSKAHKKPSAARSNSSTTASSANTDAAAADVDDDGTSAAASVLETNHIDVSSALLAIAGESNDDESGDWQAVNAKKSRRKASMASSDKRVAATNASDVQPLPSQQQQQQQQRRRRPSAKQYERVECAVTTPANVAAKVKASRNMASATLPVAAPRNALTSLPIPTVASAHEVASASASTRADNVVADATDALSDDVTPLPGVPYHTLNAIFHRTFPLADELDIPVESFVIASSATDMELQPTADGLSISQLEALQEAHLAAYHYLNEKKMELTRVLEAQRVEAKFALENEIRSLD